MSESRSTVYVAIAANLVIAAAKLTAAALGGSSAMASEAVHSFVDSANDGLLLVGMRRSRRQADAAHPFGYGHELYFYSMIVAVVIFGAGGAVSVYEGVLHVLEPEPARAVTLSYGVLAVAFVVEGISEIVAIRNFMREKGDEALWPAVRASKNPTTFMVLFEDAAALIGVVIAAAGLYCSTHFAMPVFDGIASILIGATLCAVALLLLRETRGLLLGEAADPEVLERLRRALGADPDVRHVGRLLTMHMAPHQILVNAEVHFRPGLASSELVEVLRRAEKRMRQAQPDITNIFIEPLPARREESGSRSRD